MNGNEAEIPTVDISSVIIARDERILAVHKDKWGSFALPMTKRRTWYDPNVDQDPNVEEWKDAALRAAGECLKGPFDPDRLHPLFEINEARENDWGVIYPLTRSHRDGIWKHLKIHVFGMVCEDDTELAPCLQSAWLAPGEFTTLEPISSTALEMLRLAAAEGNLPPWP